MESLLEEIQSGSFVQVATQLKESLEDSTKRIRSNDDTFKIATLPQVGDKLNKLMDDYNDILNDLEATQKTFTQLYNEQRNVTEPASLAAFEELFKETRQAERQRRAEQQRRDEDIVEEAPSELQWPKDPITKTNIKKAVRSKQCKHTYDRTSIEEYISQKERSRSTRIACPVAGCINKTLTRDELEPDDEANNIIEACSSRV